MTDARRDQIIRAFLAYSFTDVDFEYEELTDRERSFCQSKEFAALVAWIKDEDDGR